MTTADDPPRRRTLGEALEWIMSVPTDERAKIDARLDRVLREAVGLPPAPKRSPDSPIRDNLHELPE